MRNYNRKRIGHGNLYVAIDKEMGVCKIGFSTNLYTTQANLARNWEIIVSHEFDNAGSLDKRIANMLRSEASNTYQSSKSYKLNSYRVQKVIRLLRGEVYSPLLRDYDICNCIGCDNEFEAEYTSVMTIEMLLKIWEEKRYCDDCHNPNQKYCIVCEDEIEDSKITCSTKCEITYRKRKLWDMKKDTKKDVRKAWRHYKGK